MRKTTIAFIIAIFSFNAYADETVDKSLAIEYLKLSRIEEIINASIQQYEIQLFSNAEPDAKVMFHKMLVGSLGWDATKDQLADIVMKVYTKEEIEAYIAFMKSPLGASATAKGEEFSKQFSTAISTNLQKVLAECCPPRQ